MIARRTATTDRIGRATLAAVAAALIIFAAMSGHAAWRAIEAHPRHSAPVAMPTAAAPPRNAAIEPVGAATAGATGTIALPPLPLAALDATPVDSAIVAARPFSFGAASPLDRGRALQCLTAAVYYEAASEPDAGQQAVAQVVLNRVRHPAFPASVCGVVYQGSDHAGCQFSFACDGAMLRMPAIGAWARAARVAAAALAGRVYAPVGLATHYHTYAVAPAWNRALVMTDAVGAHFFHRWKGWWGTPAAFTQRYAGHEPPPAPLVPPQTPPAGLASIGVVPPVPLAAPAASAPTDQTAAPATLATTGDRLPPAATVLDRWKDSGKPLR